MDALDCKQRLVEILDSIPENKLEALLDFASYLKDKSQADDFLKMQIGSMAYREWLSSDNDVYDEVFKDEPATG